MGVRGSPILSQMRTPWLILGFLLVSCDDHPARPWENASDPCRALNSSAVTAKYPELAKLEYAQRQELHSLGEQIHRMPDLSGEEIRAKVDRLAYEQGNEWLETCHRATGFPARGASDGARAARR